MLRTTDRKRTARARGSMRSPAPARSQPRSHTKKVSLTVDEGVLRAMQKEAKRSGRTLSAEVTEALGRELRRRHLQQLITEYEAEHGRITAEELASIQAEWQD